MPTEARRVIARRHYLKHRERYLAEKSAYYHANKHKIDRAAKREYWKAWAAKNPEKAKRNPEQAARADARFKYRYSTDPEFRAQFVAHQKDYVKKNPRMLQKINLKRKYGITLEQYESMFAAQLGKCAICKRSEGTGVDKRVFLHVDHCHETQKVRGLLCSQCNRGIGFLKDSIHQLEAAIAYLKASGKT